MINANPLFVLLALSLLACNQPTKNHTLKNNTSVKNNPVKNNEVQHLKPVVNLRRFMDSLHIKPGQIRLLVDKSDRKLSVFNKQQLIKEYPVVLGMEGNDDKLMQGDRKTPEGVFHIVSKYQHKKWSRFMLLNYPTAESWKKHRQAKKDGLIPQNADIGNAIGIHGVPENDNSIIDDGIQWTLGCVSLKNTDVNELYDCISEKTEILIRK
jgi:murein L,D-transpeptidase YafK